MKKIRIGNKIYNVMYEGIEKNTSYIILFNEYNENYAIPCNNYTDFKISLNDAYCHNVSKIDNILVKYDEKWNIMEEWWDYLG